MKNLSTVLMEHRIVQRSVRSMLIAAVSAVGVVLCSQTAWGDSEIRVGVIQSLSGVAHTDGKLVVNSLELAAADLNAQGAVKIRLLVEDDASQPKNTVSAYQKLRGEGVDALIVGTWSFLVRAVLPLVGRDQAVVMNSSNFAESFDLSEGNGYFFTNALPAHEHVEALQKFLQKTPFKTAALITVNTPWGIAQAKLYREALEKSKAAVVLDESLDRVETNDWLDVMPRLQRTKPDLVVLATGHNDMDTFVKRAREVQLAGRIFGSTHTLKAFEFSANKGNFEGVCFPYPLAQLERCKMFADAYERRYHERAFLYADSSYDLLFILQQAIQISRKTSRPLEQVLKTETFKGIVGEYKFDEKRSLGAGKASLVCVQAGKMSIVE